MPTPTIEIRGLLPWVTSGDLAEIIRVIAEWYAETDGETGMTLEIHPWEVSDEKRLHLLPCIKILITYGPKGCWGHAKVKVWEGAMVEGVTIALAQALTSARAMHGEKVKRGPLTAIPGREIAVCCKDSGAEREAMLLTLHGKLSLFS